MSYLDKFANPKGIFEGFLSLKKIFLLISMIIILATLRDLYIAAKTDVLMQIDYDLSQAGMVLSETQKIAAAEQAVKFLYIGPLFNLILQPLKLALLGILVYISVSFGLRNQSQAMAEAKERYMRSLYAAGFYAVPVLCLELIVLVVKNAKQPNTIAENIHYNFFEALNLLPPQSENMIVSLAKDFNIFLFIYFLLLAWVISKAAKWSMVWLSGGVILFYGSYLLLKSLM